MASKKVLLLFILVSLLVKAEALCVLNVASINLLCFLTPFLCSLDGILSRLLSTNGCGKNDILSINLKNSETLSLNIDANIVGLQITTTGKGSITVNLGKAGKLVNITEDIILNGAGVIQVVQGAVVGIGGILHVATSGTLELAGNLAVQGGANIYGKVNLKGSYSPNSFQTAWITSPSKINVTGTPSNPATIVGNGGIDADVQFQGNTQMGDKTVQNNIYINKDLLVHTASLLQLAGNVTVNGASMVKGRLHMQGIRSASNQQNAWFNNHQVLYLEGTVENVANITGNGGVDGDVILGDYAGMAAGNSPGVLYYSGNIQMGYNSFMEIEVQGPGSADFDQYIMKNLFRDGWLYVTFLNNYFPGVNNRFTFAAHYGSTGVFREVITDIGNDVQAAYSNRSSAFAYADPVAPAYCTCTSVN